MAIRKRVEWSSWRPHSVSCVRSCRSISSGISPPAGLSLIRSDAVASISTWGSRGVHGAGTSGGVWGSFPIPLRTLSLRFLQPLRASATSSHCIWYSEHLCLAPPLSSCPQKFQPRGRRLERWRKRKTTLRLNRTRVRFTAGTVCCKQARTQSTDVEGYRWRNQDNSQEVSAADTGQSSVGELCWKSGPSNRLSQNMRSLTHFSHSHACVRIHRSEATLVHLHNMPLLLVFCPPNLPTAIFPASNVLRIAF